MFGSLLGCGLFGEVGIFILKCQIDLSVTFLRGDGSHAAFSRL